MPVPSSVRLSLIICTRNRAPQLQNALRSLQRFNPPFAWELIVVDNGSTDETQHVVRCFDGSLGAKLVVEPRRGLSAGRNSGWRASSGELVAFTDDDCYPAEDYAECVVRCFDENPTAGFVGGRVLLYSSDDARVTIQECNTRTDFVPGEFMCPGTIHGANCAFRRSVLDAVDGFDERFGAGTTIPAGEDIDILARTLALGWTGIYEPDVVVFHHHGRRGGEQIATLKRDYDRGRGAYYIKCILNPDLTYVYAKNWYWAVRRQPLAVTYRELRSAAGFLMRSGVAALFSTD